MKTILGIIFICNSLLFSSVLENKIANIIGMEAFTRHHNLILNSFKDRNIFVNNEKINYVKTLKVLKDEGLLNLQLFEPSTIKIEFEFLGSKIKAIKNLKEIMNYLGYNYFVANMIENYNNNYIYTIEYKSEFLMDAATLADELSSIDATILEIKNKQNNIWYYKIDFSNSKVYGAKNISLNEKIKLRKPLKPYLLNIDKNAKQLIVISHRLNQWYPKIGFFDEKLRFLNSAEQNRIYKAIKMDIPNNTKYIQIGDNFSLINIKRGMTVIIKD